MISQKWQKKLDDKKEKTIKILKKLIFNLELCI